jgi:hypothetical protein
LTTPVVRFALFLSSYAPASFLVAVRVASADSLLALELVALTALFVLVAALAFRILSTGNDDGFSIRTADPQREAFTAYLLGYLLPVILVDLNDTSAVTAVVLFLILLGIIFVRSNLIYLNPLLALAGYRLFACVGVLDSVETQESTLLVLAKAPHLGSGDHIDLTGADPVFRFGKVSPR